MLDDQSREVVEKEIQMSRMGSELGNRWDDPGGSDRGRVPHFFEASEGELVGGNLDTLLIIVTEYIDGINLARAIENFGPLGEKRSRTIFLDVLRTLCRLHKGGFVHRDVKPDNIMLSRDGYAYLV